MSTNSHFTVTVKCIDNDACYPAYRTGLRKVVLNRERIDKFNLLFTRLVNEYPAELRDEIRQKIVADPGITKLSADRLEIDPTKFKTGELHWIFRRCTGSDCDVLPQFIDEDLYNGFDIKKSETALAKEINQECRFQIHGLFIGDLFRHVYRTGWYK